MILDDLARDTCRPLSGPQHRLDEPTVALLLPLLPGWQQEAGKEGGKRGERISKTFRFTGFDAAMLFVNGVAWLAQRQNHHPDMEVGYNTVRITYSTHDVGGLSRNDFICAAKIEAMATL
ncbi:MAG TPA: 4a-hydroxytetrahydrobiopterin dehydratase [Azospira sp.]|nr:4a-hydroxytetrahydrobiopterin dehydratase [Azospira sp.]